MLVVTKDAFNKLKPRTKEELLAAVFSENSPTADLSSDFDWENRIEFSPGEIEDFMSTLNEETTNALKVIAEQGPYVHATLLDSSGISDYASFQRSTTRRTRTMTGNGEDFFLAWDNWQDAENGIGRYAVTHATHRSLRIFFELD